MLHVLMIILIRAQDFYCFGLGLYYPIMKTSWSSREYSGIERHAEHIIRNYSLEQRLIGIGIEVTAALTLKAMMLVQEFSCYGVLDLIA